MRSVAVCEVAPVGHALPARVLDGERDTLIVAVRDGAFERVLRVELGAEGEACGCGWRGMRREGGELVLRSPEGRVFVIGVADR